jgi:hypothetical protein
MENQELESLISQLDEIQYGITELNENKIESEIYSVSRKLNNINDLLSLACAVSMISFSDEFTGIEIAKNIVDRAIEIAVKDKNLAGLQKIADELENSLEIDDLAEEVREIITGFE